MPSYQEGKLVLVFSSAHMQIASKNQFLFCTKSQATDLFEAAYSGNIGLFDLLVQRFDLPPDQWKEVRVFCPVLCN